MDGGRRSKRGPWRPHPYRRPRRAADYAPWADHFRYDRPGAFAAEQLRLAHAPGDYVKIVWAAGWVMHVIESMNCHGTYVNPECNVVMSLRRDHLWLAFNNATSRSIALLTAAQGGEWINHAIVIDIVNDEVVCDCGPPTESTAGVAVRPFRWGRDYVEVLKQKW